MQFVDLHEDSKEIFFHKTGISSSNFKGKGAKSELGGDKIVKILTIYDKINPDWLITGNGPMLKTVTDKIIVVNEDSVPYGLAGQVEQLNFMIQTQNTIIEGLQKQLEWYQQQHIQHKKKVHT